MGWGNKVWETIALWYRVSVRDNKKLLEPGVVAHNYNPSFLGS
jgi:hypothetical protein